MSFISWQAISKDCLVLQCNAFRIVLWTLFGKQQCAQMTRKEAFWRRFLSKMHHYHWWNLDLFFYLETTQQSSDRNLKVKQARNKLVNLKMMLVVIFDCHGVACYEFLSTLQTINKSYYLSVSVMKHGYVFLIQKQLNNQATGAWNWSKPEKNMSKSLGTRQSQNYVHCYLWLSCWCILWIHTNSSDSE